MNKNRPGTKLLMPLIRLLGRLSDFFARVEFLRRTAPKQRYCEQCQAYIDDECPHDRTAI